MKIIKPEMLKNGDAVGVISPSEPVVFKRQLEKGVKELEKLGLKVVLGKNIFKQYGGYMAGTIKERLEDFHKMAADPKIKAIFTSRGGFCSSQLLDKIDYSLIKKKPKIIMGLSDITVLLNAIHKKTGLITFHGPSVEFGIPAWNAFTKNYFLKATFQNKPFGKISRLPETKWKIIKKGKAGGRLVGGNLSVLRALLGTKYCPDWTNALFFWEDCEITREDLDHFLTHLKLAGVFEKINGIIIGKLQDFKKIEGDSDLKKFNFFSPEKIILDNVQKYDFPIIGNVDFGHHCPQITIPIGCYATIDTSKNIFSIDESGVI